MSDDAAHGKEILMPLCYQLSLGRRGDRRGAWYPAGPRPNVRVRVLCQPHGIATRPPPGIPFMTATLLGHD